MLLKFKCNDTNSKIVHEYTITFVNEKITFVNEKTTGQ